MTFLTFKGAEKLINRFQSCKKIIQLIIFMALISFGTKNAFRNYGKSYLEYFQSRADLNLCH